MGSSMTTSSAARTRPAPPVWDPRGWGRHVRFLGWASLVANIAIVVTGGAVRLTGSGLGCPTWPRCTEQRFTPHGEFQLHAAIEFGNRLLTFVLAAIAIATVVAAWQTGRRELRRLAIVLFLSIPAQAVVGGITVLTGLNPWLVSVHLLISMAMVALAVLFLRRIDQPVATSSYALSGPLSALAWAVLAATWAVLYIGTVVTGAGPHAGDIDTPRNGLDPAALSQLHADAVFLLVGLTVGLWLAGLAVHGRHGTRSEVARAGRFLLVVVLAQGLVGFVQYFTDLPEILVGIHMLGAGVVAAATTWAVLAVLLPRTSATDTGDTGATDDSAAPAEAARSV